MEIGNTKLKWRKYGSQLQNLNLSMPNPCSHPQVEGIFIPKEAIQS